MNAVEIYEKAIAQLEQNKIDCGEFNEMIEPLKDVELVRHGHWIIKCVRKYELSDGETAYVPEYECSWCGFTTESYVRLDEPIMPEDADFPKYCEYCGTRMDDNNEQSSQKG